MKKVRKSKRHMIMKKYTDIKKYANFILKKNMIQKL